MPIRRSSIAAALLWFGIAGPAVAQTYELRGGRWFDGRTFVARTMFVEQGRFVARRPARVDSVIDLTGRFVVPPFGEAHNHNIEGARTEVVAAYLAAGIFYVKDPCSFPEARVEAIGKLNTPTSIDGIFSGGCITSPGGHPSGLVKRNIARGVMQPTDGDGRFLHAVVDSADFERRWPGIVAAKPDFIKVILVYSENHARTRDDPAEFNWRGLDPALLPLVVRRAHAAGLRVSSHIESAADFRTALAAGVDEINHMPGFRPAHDSIGAWADDLTRYQLTDDDARRAARQRTVVVTTLGEAIDLLARGDKAGLDSATRQRVRDLYARNLRTLRARRVQLAFGSDQFRANTVPEVLALRTLGVFDDAELLRVWAMATPRAIFPRRRIGCFDAGCEASLLALRGDPLADFENVRCIDVRMKQGVLLH